MYCSALETPTRTGGTGGCSDKYIQHTHTQVGTQYSIHVRTTSGTTISTTTSSSSSSSSSSDTRDTGAHMRHSLPPLG